MEKLLYIVLALLLAAPAMAADYFGCASADISADNTFCSTPSGSCAGSNAVSGATALASGNNLYANGCTIVVDADFNIGTGKISTQDGDAGGAAVAGGTYTLAMPTVGNTRNITAYITAGSTDCLGLSGAGTGTVTIVGKITGGSTSAKVGLNDSRSAGTVNVTGDVIGGSTVTTHGIGKFLSGGALNITGNVEGGASTGHGISLLNYGGNVTVTGDCIGGGADGASANGSGCYVNNMGATYTFTVTGNIIDSLYSSGIFGRFVWNPSADSKYYKVKTTSGNFFYLSKAPAAANVAVGTSVVDSSDGSYDAGSHASGGGGGAWGF